MKLLIITLIAFDFYLTYRKHSGRVRILFYIRPVVYSIVAKKKFFKLIIYKLKT